MPIMNELEEDAMWDRWTDGAIAGSKGLPCPADDPDTREGYEHGLRQRVFLEEQE